MLMYAFFALNGFFDICVMIWRLDQPSKMNRPPLLPAGTQRMTLLLALSAEFVLFRFHLFGKSDLDSHVHVLLLICNGAGILATVAEWQFTNQPIAALSRAIAALFMGAWFIQVSV
jgi:hypothetical protein